MECLKYYFVIFTVIYYKLLKMLQRFSKKRLGSKSHLIPKGYVS